MAMLFLYCEVEGQRYAIPAHRIVEVLPLVSVRAFPQMRRGVVGVIQYRGESVMVIDFSLLVSGRPSNAFLSTRIVIATIHKTDGSTSSDPVIGLIVERATRILPQDPKAFSLLDGVTQETPFLGPVAWDGTGNVRRVELDGFSSWIGQTVKPERVSDSPVVAP